MSAIIASTFTGLVLVATALYMGAPGAALVMALVGMLAFITHMPDAPFTLKLVCWLAGIVLSIGVLLNLIYRLI